jgi:hypothetical protein
VRFACVLARLEASPEAAFQFLSLSDNSRFAGARDVANTGGSGVHRSPNGGSRPRERVDLAPRQAWLLSRIPSVQCHARILLTVGLALVGAVRCRRSFVRRLRQANDGA